MPLIYGTRKEKLLKCWFMGSFKDRVNQTILPMTKNVNNKRQWEESPSKLSWSGVFFLQPQKTSITRAQSHSSCLTDKSRWLSIYFSAISVQCMDMFANIPNEIRVPLGQVIRQDNLTNKPRWFSYRNIELYHSFDIDDLWKFSSLYL